MWANFRGASKNISLCLTAIILVSCSGNVLTELSNEASDEALYEEALKDINDGNYVGAVQACIDMSAGATADRSVAYVCASAYSGRCGLDFLSLLTAIEAYAAAPVLNTMMFFSSVSHGATATNVSDCATSTGLLQGIGAAATRTADENLLMVFNNIMTLGVVGNFYADTDDNDVRDPAYDTCGDIDNATADIVTEAFWELKESAGSTGITELTGFATTINAACATLPGINDFCSATDPSAFTLDETKGAKGLFREDTGSFGLGDCGGLPAACVCP